MSIYITSKLNIEILTSYFKLTKIQMFVRMKEEKLVVKSLYALE